MENFAQNSLDWQLTLLNRRFWEWVSWFLGQQEGPDLNNDGWVGFWDGLGDIILTLLVVGLSLWGTWTLWRLLRPYYFQWRGQKLELPTPPQPEHQSVDQWRKQARQYQQSRNYTQACLCLYLGMLQHLNDTEIALHQESRTDGEYHRAIAHHPQPSPYYTLLAMHQSLKFGNQPATPELLTRCFKAYAKFS